MEIEGSVAREQCVTVLITERRPKQLRSAGLPAMDYRPSTVLPPSPPSVPHLQFQGLPRRLGMSRLLAISEQGPHAVDHGSPRL